MVVVVRGIDSDVIGGGCNNASSKDIGIILDRKERKRNRKVRNLSIVHARNSFSRQQNPVLVIGVKHAVKVKVHYVTLTASTLEFVMFIEAPNSKKAPP